MHIEANQKYILVDNYLQINQIKHDLIELKNINIYGRNLRISKITPNIIVVEGIIKTINIKDD